jgi:hypothetical protein
VGLRMDGADASVGGGGAGGCLNYTGDHPGRMTEDYMTSNQDSTMASVERLEDEAWWPSARQPRPSRLDPGRIVCLGHFLAWLNARNLQVTDCTEERLAEYEESLARFGPGLRAAYACRAREFMRIVEASQPRSPSPARR